MKNFVVAISLFFLCLFAHDSAFGAAAATTEEDHSSTKKRIPSANSTMCSYEAAHHAYSQLMGAPNLDGFTRALIKSSYLINVLENGCLGKVEGEWTLRGPNKRTNHVLLRGTVQSYYTLFDWEPGTVNLSMSEDNSKPAGHVYFRFSTGYELHAPQSEEERAYVMRLKAECATQQDQCVIS